MLVLIHKQFNMTTLCISNCFVCVIKRQSPDWNKLSFCPIQAATFQQNIIVLQCNKCEVASNIMCGFSLVECNKTIGWTNGLMWFSPFWRVLSQCTRPPPLTNTHTHTLFDFIAIYSRFMRQSNKVSDTIHTRFNRVIRLDCTLYGDVTSTSFAHKIRIYILLYEK